MNFVKHFLRFHQLSFLNLHFRCISIFFENVLEQLTEMSILEYIQLYATTFGVEQCQAAKNMFLQHLLQISSTQSIILQASKQVININNKFKSLSNFTKKVHIVIYVNSF